MRYMYHAAEQKQNIVVISFIGGHPPPNPLQLVGLSRNTQAFHKMIRKNFGSNVKIGLIGSAGDLFHL